MKVTRAIERIKAETHDISEEYSEQECLDFINTAIQQVSSLLASAKWPVLVQETLIMEGDSLPTNYLSACGTYPVSMTAGKVHLTDSNIKNVRFRYFATPKLIESDNDELPFNHDAINEVIVKSAVLIALNQNEYDITQDNNIVQALQSAISAGIS